MRYAYIFDVDGVLLSTMEAHFECYKQALEEVKVPIDKEQFFRQAGMKGSEQIMYFARNAGVAVDVEKVYARKRELFERYVDSVEKIECNIELIRALRSAGFPVGIASGSARKSWVPILTRFGIQADAMAGAEDVKRGKPHPDLYLEVAEKLGVPPSHCIVVEDSEAGIDAARAAGMKAMRFYDNLSRK
jgi:HAD superfamily hydrolase (TIGR01509 family)